MKHDFKIKSGIYTILVSSGHIGGRFEFEGLKFNSEPNVVFSPHVHKGDVIEEGITYKSIEDMISDKIREKADKQLQAWVEKNISNTAFYTSLEHGNNDTFWQVNKWYKNAYPTLDNGIHLEYKDISDGIVIATINHFICTYDFAVDGFTSITKLYSTKSESAMDIFYKDYLYSILAVEQHRRGFGHKAFTELVGINEFLDGKKSVKLNMKDGSVVEFSNGNGLSVTDILWTGNNEFILADNKYLSDRRKARSSASEIISLQHGKTVYPIMPFNLDIKD
jgi:hypothetical protein